MLTLTYKNEIFNVISTKETTFSIAGEVIDNGIKFICENGRVFYYDKDSDSNEYYDQKHCD